MSRFLIVFLLIGCLKPVFAQDTWTQVASLPTNQYGGVSFVLNDTAYVVTGINSSSYSSIFYKYNALQNKWEKKVNFPGDIRTNAFSFTIGNKAYLGTGIGSNGLMKDFWEFDQLTNKWTRKKDFPGSARENAVGLSVGNKGYVISGSKYNDTWQYNPQNDTWISKAILPGGGLQFPVGFSIGGDLYVGLGSDLVSSPSSKFYKYDTLTNKWTNISDYPGAQIFYNAVSFTINDIAYVGTGTSKSNALTSQFWSYNPLNDKWTQMNDFLGAKRESGVAFVLNNTAYTGVGRASSTTYQDFWKYNPLVTGIEDKEISKVENVIFKENTIEFQNVDEVIIYDLNGMVCFNKKCDYEKNFNISLSSFTNGFYFIKTINENGNLSVKKFIK